MKAPKQETNFVKAPIGNHVARCVQMIDLGTQVTKKGSASRKIRISWELCHATHVFKEEKGQEHFMVSSEYGFSMWGNSYLRKMIEGWAGKKLDDKVAEEMDISKILGKPCMVSTLESPDGKYVNVASVAMMPEGVTAPPATIEQILFSLDEPDWGMFEKLGQRTKDKIKLSPEYAAAIAGAAPADDMPPTPDQPPKSAKRESVVHPPAPGSDAARDAFLG